ncbi:MAG: hypothetical protein ACI8ZM_002717 [Crocinitomix sp.]|jgi:hypothetical protein
MRNGIKSLSSVRELDAGIGFNLRLVRYSIFFSNLQKQASRNTTFLISERRKNSINLNKSSENLLLFYAENDIVKIKF